MPIESNVQVSVRPRDCTHVDQSPYLQITRMMSVYTWVEISTQVTQLRGECVYLQAILPACGGYHTLINVLSIPLNL